MLSYFMGVVQANRNDTVAAISHKPVSGTGEAQCMIFPSSSVFRLELAKVQGGHAVDALGMALAMIELGEVASFASNFAVTDFSFWFHPNSLCFHEVLLCETSARESSRFSLALG